MRASSAPARDTAPATTSDRRVRPTVQAWDHHRNTRATDPAATQGMPRGQTGVARMRGQGTVPTKATTASARRPRGADSGRAKTRRPTRQRKAQAMSRVSTRKRPSTPAATSTRAAALPNSEQTANRARASPSRSSRADRASSARSGTYLISIRSSAAGKPPRPSKDRTPFASPEALAASGPLSPLKAGNSLEDIPKCTLQYSMPAGRRL